MKIRFEIGQKRTNVKIARATELSSSEMRFAPTHNQIKCLSNFQVHVLYSKAYHLVDQITNVLDPTLCALQENITSFLFRENRANYKALKQQMF